MLYNLRLMGIYKNVINLSHHSLTLSECHQLVVVLNRLVDQLWNSYPVQLLVAQQNNTKISMVVARNYLKIPSESRDWQLASGVDEERDENITLVG